MLAKRGFQANLAVVVTIGAVVRIVRFLATKWNRPLVPPLNDSLYYSAQAHELAHGKWFHEVFSNQPGAEHGPLTSSIMALVSWGDDPVNRQRMVTVATGIGVVAVIGLVGRRVGGDRVGLFAAALAAIYPNLWINDGLVMSESISCLVVATLLLLLLRWTETPRAARAAVFGGVVGLGALARSEVLLVAPLAAVLMVLVGNRRAIDYGRQVLLSLAATAAVVAPWVVFNATRFERPVLLTTNEGTLWLGANCPDSYYGDAIGGWSLFCVLDADLGQPGGDTSVRRALQRGRGLSYAADHLARLPVVVAARIGRTFDVYDVSGLVHGDVGEERERLFAWAGVVAFWLLAPCAVFGALRLRRLHRGVVLVPIVLVAVTTVLFYGGHRLRSAAEPSLVILAAVALDAWTSRSTRRAQP
jgi:4-amino-4-deoxy-L-arabinose transferase-like glycosyltransferase